MGIKLILNLFVIVLLGETCYGWSQHFGYNHGGNSEYVHSNDTMFLELHENTILKVEPNSRHNLEFILENRGAEGHFSIRYDNKIIQAISVTILIAQFLICIFELMIQSFVLF